MNYSTKATANQSVALTYLPRVLSGLVLLTIGGFMLAYFIGGQETSSRALTLADYVSLAGLATSLIGLAAAWKWERLGAAITLAAVAVGTLFNWALIMSPLVMIPIVAVVFLLCDWLKNNAAGLSKA